ncbi:MAG: 2-C-methyl-D-erythritol 4-phosphate cytidylyltransferase [Bacteroidia bacterium]|nr:2-C-methyl-D-erythritol 4-phosphate cytidylyltransferase [Bacteroidia bacterium]NNC85484.1 2-C-methyl-D-erythritol 4-phosphate cytidylyltransferase [Bacteroidia bacterium]NNM15848.1 2-C-methyl-D-erythritol 4-phosphate cytidylyltransferase [Bacteroidia bacterium]
MDKYAIIVAAGSGSRMNAKLPKQFMPLAKLPMLFHTIHSFTKITHHILLVLQEKDFQYWHKICNDYKVKIPVTLVPGGNTRHESVKNAVQNLPDDCMVAIHDGARPLVTPTLIAQLFLLAEQKGNAVPVVPLKDSIRKLSKEGNTSENRNQYVAVQTPQCFKTTELKQAFQSAKHNDYTDEASLYDDLNKAVFLNEGSHTNIKVTNPEDMVIAEVLFMALNKAQQKG